MYQKLIASLRSIGARMMPTTDSASIPSGAVWRTTEKGNHILIKNGKVISGGIVSDWIRVKKSDIKNQGKSQHKNISSHSENVSSPTPPSPLVREESFGLLKKNFISLITTEHDIPDGAKSDYIGTTPSQEAAEKSIGEFAGVLKDFSARFPKHNIPLSKVHFYPALYSLAKDSVAGAFRRIASPHPLIKPSGILTLQAMSKKLEQRVLGMYEMYAQNPDTLKNNVQFYYPVEWFQYVSALHEMAHVFFTFNSLTCGFSEAISECKIDFNWNPKTHLSKYSAQSLDEAHSECVAMVACPLYKIGTLPEPIERYVFEKVLGCPKDSWKKKGV